MSDPKHDAREHANTEMKTSATESGTFTGQRAKAHPFRAAIATIILVSIPVSACGGSSSSHSAADTAAVKSPPLGSYEPQSVASGVPTHSVPDGTLATPAKPKHHTKPAHHHTKPAHHTKAKPAPTYAQQQAIASAKDYLSTEPGFSRAKLIEQLSSKYGEGFPKAIATYAVDSLHVNWNWQAEQSAKNYLQTEPGFSREGLIQQLTSSYGEDFTLAQAEYGVRMAYR